MSKDTPRQGRGTKYFPHQQLVDCTNHGRCETQEAKILEVHFDLDTQQGARKLQNVGNEGRRAGSTSFCVSRSLSDPALREELGPSTWRMQAHEGHMICESTPLQHGGELLPELR